MFEIASRKKFRFDSVKGALSVEDLWDLPLTSATGKANLDDIAKGLNQKLKESTTESFVSPVSSGDQVTASKLDIIKHVIAVKLAERDAAHMAAAKAAQKQRVLEVLAQKKDAALGTLSIEELENMAKSL